MPNPYQLSQSKVETISTIVDDVNVDKLQQALENSRRIFLQGYLSQGFTKIETALASNFRFVNGKEIRTRENWHDILTNLWQSRDWHSNPLLPDRMRYHFFSPTECMVTLYYKDEKTANVMQELWLQDDNTWKLSAVSIVNR